MIDYFKYMYMRSLADAITLICCLLWIKSQITLNWHECQKQTDYTSQRS